MEGWNVQGNFGLKYFVSFVGVLMFLKTGIIYGGDRVNVRGMGMSRTTTAVARGLDAVGINPANLALSDGSVMTFTVLPMGVSAESDFLSYDLYSRYFKDRQALMSLPEADKQAILNSFEGPIGNGNAEAVARLFGIALRTDPSSAIAFTVDYGLIGAGRIPREYARLLLYGNVPGSAFNIDGIAVQAYWARTYALSVGWLLPKPTFLGWLAGGIGVKMLQGYGYYGIERGSASLRTATDGTLSGAVSWQARWTSTNSFSDPMNNLFQNPTGYGLGFDVGVSGGVDDYFSFGVSLTDIGSIKWTRDVHEMSSDSVMLGNNPDVFKNVFALANPASSGMNKVQGFSSSLPTLLRLGISAQVDRMGGRDEFPGEMLIAAEYLQGFGSDSPLAEQPRLSVGLEYRPTHWLPIRTGISLGGSGSSHLSFGLGFNVRSFDFDIATEDIRWLFDGQHSNTGSIGLGIRFRISG